MKQEEIKNLLDSALEMYNNKNFIESDPVSIPHLFNKKQDIEIAGFLSATIAWGQRKSILNNAFKVMQLMDFEPHAFVLSCSFKELKQIEKSKFVHRTFNAKDLSEFIIALKSIYTNFKSMECAFTHQSNDLVNKITAFRNFFVKNIRNEKTLKHISNPEKNSACKRLNMFLRWMVRKDNAGIDFGLWKSINPADLLCPLDIHSGNIAREINLLNRKQNDLKATLELTNNLKQFCPEDPIKYDIALFGIGVNRSYSKTKPS